jgi:hypothetical protein
MLQQVAQLTMVDVCEVKRHERMRNLMVIPKMQTRGRERLWRELHLELPRRQKRNSGEIRSGEEIELRFGILQNENEIGCSGTYRRLWCG